MVRCWRCAYAVPALSDHVWQELNELNAPGLRERKVTRDALRRPDPVGTQRTAGRRLGLAAVERGASVELRLRARARSSVLLDGDAGAAEPRSAIRVAREICACSGELLFGDGVGSDMTFLLAASCGGSWVS